MSIIIDWCTNNQGFLMALLTAIYVIATISLVKIGHQANAISEKNKAPLDNYVQKKQFVFDVFARR